MIAPVLRCSKLGEFTVTPGKLRWPWVAFSPERSSFAVPESRSASTVYGAASLDRQTRFDLPGVLPVPTEAPSSQGTTSRQPGLHAVAVHPDDGTVVGFGWHGDLPAACVLRPGLRAEVVDLGPVLGEMGPMAATFTRGGESIWLSAESRLTNYNGARIDGRFVVSATATIEDDDGGEDQRALVIDDARKLEDDAPAPPGMWAGRLGRNRLVTIGRENGDRRTGFLYAIDV
jgi:hypothetical protein